MRLTTSVLLSVALTCAACAKPGDQVAADSAAIAAAADAAASQPADDGMAAANTVAEAAAIAAANRVDLTFTDLSGDAQLPPDLSSTTVIVVATWCAYSQKYIEVVSDLSRIGLLDSERIVFIFADEKAHIAGEAKESLETGAIDKDRYKRIVEDYGLDSESPEPVFFDPGVLDTLPAKGFITVFPKNGGPKAFPTRLSSLTGETDDMLMESTQKVSFLNPEQFRRVLRYYELLAPSNAVSQD